jgi:hypothetical protein
MAAFATEEARTMVVAKSPWHFKQDLLAFKSLCVAPTAADGESCRTDPALEGMGKWETFARLKIELDPTEPLYDRIPLLLLGGESWEVLVHYEIIPIFCLYCGRIGNEVEIISWRTLNLTLHNCMSC